MELSDRDGAEDRVRAALEDFFGPARTQVSRTIGYPPRLEAIDRYDWGQHQDQLAQTLYRALAPVWRRAAEQAIFCDPAQDRRTIDRQVVESAQRQAIDHARRITTTTRRQVADAIAAHTAGEIGRRDYYARLRTIFTGPRIDAIAVTLVTEAAVGGMEFSAQACEREKGVQYRRVWRTSKDEKVCPICDPLDGKTKDVWGLRFPDGPPAHVNCRCSIEHQRPVRRQRV